MALIPRSVGLLKSEAGVTDGLYDPILSYAEEELGCFAAWEVGESIRM
jgi:hypothetical protein